MDADPNLKWLYHPSTPEEWARHTSLFVTWPCCGKDLLPADAPQADREEFPQFVHAPHGEGDGL